MYLFIKGILKSLDQFIDSMISGLDIDYQILDLSDEPKVTSNIASLDREITPDSVIISFNNVGLGIHIDGQNYWAAKKVTFYNILVDHPLYYKNEIESFSFPGLFYVCIDQSHADFLKAVFPERRDSFLFLPHGGTCLNKSLCQDKPTDILYIGSVPPPSDLNERKNDELVDSFYTYAENYLKQEKYPQFYKAVIDYIKALSLPLEREYIFLFMKLFVHYATCQTSLRRINLVKSLCDNGFHVTVYGHGIWTDLSQEYPPEIFDYKGFISPEKCVEEISRSKITLNDSPFFLYGAHERIFNGMYNGSVVLTNTSAYVESRFSDMENILLWNGTDVSEAIDKISLVLSDDDYRLSLASRAYKKLDHDTWSDRANYLFSHAKRLKGET